MTTKDSNFPRGRLNAAICAVAGLTVGLATPLVHANPSEDDATIVAGTAIFDAYGNLLTITTSDMSIIDWLSFNIGVGETVQFIMPDASSRVLNRISGATPSEINGTLTANGQVFLVNPSGIVFGENAVVNAGSLYAAAGNISNADFMAETYRFTDLQGSVVNRGHLQGNVIALLGGEVANIGTISAPEGTVIMAAGEQVLIGTHLGSRFVEIEIPLDASEATTTEDSAPRLAAGDIYSIAAWNTGTINADHVFMKADGGDVLVSGNINATGADNNGFLTVRGDNIIVESNTKSRGTPITAGSVKMTADPGGVIDLGSNISTTGTGISFFGDVRLTESVSLSSTGAFSDTHFSSDVFSEAGEYNTLSVFASNGDAYFGGAIGVDPTSDQRLGFLDVDTRLTSYLDNVSTRDGMTLMGYTEVRGPSVTFHTGMGSALFGGHIFSHIRGGSDVAFMYDGEVWTGDGEARTPFKFQGSIGTGIPFHSVPNQGPFRTVRFGDDINGASQVAAAFLFSNAATEGLSLMDASAIDLSTRFFISATEGIYAGRGQKITSMGSIQFAVKTLGSSTIQLSDVNALGDIRILSQGRMGNDIVLLGHLGGLIHGTGNEGDRTGGGYDEQAAELIASGTILLDGTIVTDTAGAMLGAESVVLANNSGSGTTLGLAIQPFPGGASLANFMGTLTNTSDQVYAYDLTLGPLVFPTNPTTTRANLGSVFADEDQIQLRDDAPYLAQRQVLIELGLAPEYVAGETVREGIQTGSERYTVAPDQSPAVIMDRLSQRSVERLTDAYIALFGQRDAQTEQRVGVSSVVQRLSSGDQDEIEIAMSEIGIVLDRIALLELTPIEIQRAQDRLLDMVRPSSMDASAFRSQWARN
jgi:filamentous hemagglutinin family protein